MRRNVVLPTRSFTWAGVGLSGGGSVPAQGLVLTFETPSDQIDSAMPPKTHAEAPQHFYSSGMTGAMKGSSQTLFGEENPRLTSRSCGEFPGTGRTFPSRHFRPDCSQAGAHFTHPLGGNPFPAPLARPSVPSLNRSSDSNRCPVALGHACLGAFPAPLRALSWLPPGTASPLNTSRQTAPPAYRPAASPHAPGPHATR